MTGLSKVTCFVAFALAVAATDASAQDSDQPTAVLHGASTVDAFRVAAWQPPVVNLPLRATDAPAHLKNEAQAELQQERQEKALNRRLNSCKEC